MNNNLTIYRPAINGQLDMFWEDKSLWLRDHLSPEGTLVKNYLIGRYVKEHYNLTPRQYFSLIVYNDKDYRFRCPHCDATITVFISCRKGHPKFCCMGCRTSYGLIKASKEGRNPFQNPEFIEINRIRASETQTRRMLDGTHQLLTKESQAKASRNNLLSTGLKYKCELFQLYIARVKDNPELLKIGVTGPNGLVNGARENIEVLD